MKKNARMVWQQIKQILLRRFIFGSKTILSLFLQGNQERATKIILNNELLLLKELNFNLTVHNPFRFKCNPKNHGVCRISYTAPVAFFQCC